MAFPNFSFSGNSSLNELVIGFLRSSGLVEAIKEIVREALADVHTSDTPLNNDDGNPYYTRAELLRLAHLSEPTLYRLEKAGVVKKIKLGRKNLYSRLEIDALLGSGGFHYSSKKHEKEKKK